MKQRFAILVYTFTAFILSGCRSDRHFVGAYETLMPAEFSTTRTITLDLKPNHTATLTTNYQVRLKIEQKGKWKGTGNQLTVDLEKSDQAPEQMLIWSLQGNLLIPISWDRSQWGVNGLRLERKAAVPPAPAPAQKKAR